MAHPAIHVAVKNDHRLSGYGASSRNRNKMGELPLHTYILTSESELLICKVIYHHDSEPVVSVEPPSAQAGQIALDLVVSRVMEELSNPTHSAVSLP
jgi:hypothetical protein